MIRQIIILLLLSSITFAQSGFDILSLPTDAKDASLGISLNPIVKPTRIVTHPEYAATLNVWNWVADIQGVYMGLGLKNNYFSVQGQFNGELEYRDETPTEDPLSTFGYSIFNIGAAHVLDWDEWTLGIGSELLYERSLNASATALAVNLAGSYRLNEKYFVSAGLRHLGSGGKLDNEKTDLPTEVWFGADADFDRFSALAELNTGSFPFSAGMTYTILEGFEVMTGVQLESTEPSLSIHPSAGFTATWTSFTVGYAIYQLDHNLGPRHFLSLYWTY